MQVIIQTRFSYFGQSGWRSDASTQEALLYDDARLEQRFNLFEAITIPSLKAQTDKDFHWHVLSSKGMPDKWRKRLTEVCSDVLPADKLAVTFRGPRSAAKIFRKVVRQRFDPAALISQVVLDDDDALSADFIATCKRVGYRAWRQRDKSKDYVFTTFPRGCTLVLDDSSALYLERYVPFTNLGLTLTCRPDCKRNLFAISHKRIGERHPFKEFDDGKLRYVRTIHDHNDSRGLYDEASKSISPKDLKLYFPNLSKKFKIAPAKKKPTGTKQLEKV